MTFERAKELSILKWEWFSKHGRSVQDEDNEEHYDRLLTAIPMLEKVTNYCGFCSRYYMKDCKNCPVKVGDLNCADDDHAYWKWYEETDNNKSRYLAKKILAIVKNAKEIK